MRKRPMREIFDFEWEVMRRGYSWVEAEKANPHRDEVGKVMKYLTDGAPLDGAREQRRYAPLRDTTGLFRIFAFTSPSEEGIQAFASHYGWLGGEGRTYILLPPQSGQKTGHPNVGEGEPLSLWQEHITAMRQVVTVWDMVRFRNVKGLDKHMKDAVAAADSVRDAVKAASFDSHPGSLKDGVDAGTLFSILLHPDLFPFSSPGDAAQRGMEHLRHVVNHHLHGRVSPQLRWQQGRTELGLNLVPYSLIGALWLQCAQAIAGEKEYRQCEQCDRWFEISPTVRLGGRLFCSNACRSRAYRGRQDEARQLHQQGHSLKKIASQLKTDTSTAKGWIKKGKEK